MTTEHFTITPLDLEILRLMYRGRPDSLSGIDPRLNASRISKSLSTNRSRISSRMRTWVKSGFLIKYAVWLNPSLFGYRGCWTGVRTARAGYKTEVIRRLGLIDGVISATEFLGTNISIGVIAQDLHSLRQRLELIGGLSGVEEVGKPEYWLSNPVHHKLTPVELRLVKALRANPTSSLNEAARSVKVSIRTLSKKYTNLIENSIVWFQPVMDYRAIAGTVLTFAARLKNSLDADVLTKHLGIRYPLVLRLNNEQGMLAGPGTTREWAVVLQSASQIDDFLLHAGSIDGVEIEDWKIPVMTYDFPDSFDWQLNRLAGRA